MIDRKLEEYKKGLKRPYTGMTIDLRNKIDGIEIEEEKVDLDDMSKDELNDYAVKIGLDDEVSMDMLKQEMIDVIKKHEEGDK